MQNIIIACNTLRDEVQFVAEDLKIDYPILWIESGLHDTPDKLNDVLQEQINRVDNVQNIILLFGICGNSLLGLSSANAQIVFPKVDDCISLFLGGNDRRVEMDRELSAYYFTRGYLESESNIWTEYDYCVNKYGSKKAKMIIQKMLNNYEGLRVIDTGAYELTEVCPETNKLAKELDLVHEVVEGTLELVYKALKAEWDEDFVIVEPGQAVTYNDLDLD